jgi:ABC-type xylose transport system permease subunit
MTLVFIICSLLLGGFIGAAIGWFIWFLLSMPDLDNDK